MGQKAENQDVRGGRGPEVVGMPGEGARAMGVVRSGWPVLCMLFVSGYLLGSALPFPVGPTGLGLALLVAAGGVAALVSVCEGRWKRHLKGAEGEIRVARALERLPEGYLIRHGLAMEALRDVDHVVLGPHGLFVVETKNWQGPIVVEEGEWTVGGELGVRSPVAQAEAVAAALAERIRAELGIHVSVQSVVCLAGADVIPPQTAVCTPETLCRWIEEGRMKPVIGEGDRERIRSWLGTPEASE